MSLSGSDEYASSPKLQSGELQGGFKVPSFMLAKMRTFMASVRTDPTASDDVLLAVAARAAASSRRLQQLESVTTRPDYTPSNAGSKN